MKIGQLPNAFAETDAATGKPKSTIYGDIWDVVTYGPTDLYEDISGNEITLVDDATVWLQKKGLNVLFILLGIGGLTFLAFKSLK